jgi:hypothetical protein
VADPIERVFALLDWYRDAMVAGECRRGCPVGNLALEVADRHPEVRPDIHANFVHWAAGIEKWLREAGDRLVTDIDPAALSRFVLTIMEGALMQARASADLAAFDDSVRTLRDYFQRLAAPASGAASREEGT